MADLSKLRFNGTDYNVKDASAPTRKFTNTYSKSGNLPISSDDTTQTAIGKLENCMTPKSSLVDVVDNGAKNYLFFTLDDVKEGMSSVSGTWTNNVYSYSGGGSNLTFTVNDDCSITVNGTTSSYAFNFMFLISSKIPSISERVGAAYINGSTIQPTDSLHCVLRGNPNVENINIDNGGEIPDDLSQYTRGMSIRVNENSSFSNVKVYPLVTTKSRFDISSAYEPYALGNQILTPALIEQVDSGAKNLVNLADSTTTGSAYVFRNAPISLAAGSYVFSYTSNQSSSGNIQMIVYNDSTDIFDVIVTSQAGRVAIPFTISSDATMITLYSVRAGTYSNFMICTLADWNASHKYVPHRRDWDNIINLIEYSLTPWTNIATGANLNNIPTTMASKGVYSMFAIGTSDALNVPADGIFMVRTYRLATGTAVQEVTMLTGNDRGKVYSRTFINNDSWSSWIQLTNV